MLPSNSIWIPQFFHLYHQSVHFLLPRSPFHSLATMLPALFNCAPNYPKATMQAFLISKWYQLKWQAHCHISVGKLPLKHFASSECSQKCKEYMDEYKYPKEIVRGTFQELSQYNFSLSYISQFWSIPFTSLIEFGLFDDSDEDLRICKNFWRICKDFWRILI